MLSDRALIVHLVREEAYLNEVFYFTKYLFWLENVSVWGNRNNE